MTRTKQTLALTPLRKCASGKLASLVILALSAAGDTYAQGPIHQLSYAAPNWAWTDVQLPGPGASQSSGVAAFNTTPNNQFHIFYQDVSNNIHGLYFNGSLWSDGNMTAAIPGASALPYGSGISGFSIGNFQYVYFVGSDQHIHEFSYVDNWVDTDVTERSRGATPKPIGKLVSYATSPNNQRHVYYVATDATIHQLYWNGIQWSDENLTSFTGGALADTSNIGGCAVGNFQYIFFASHGHLHMYSYVNSWTDTDWTDISGISNVFYVSGFGTPGTTKFSMLLLFVGVRKLFR